MKFNLLKSKTARKVVNHEGARAFAISPAMELYTAVVTTSLSDKFYEAADDRIIRIRELIAKNDPVFVAKLAVYAREQMHLRSIPLVLAVELAAQHRGDSIVGDLTGRIVQRADEITELLAYYSIANDRKEVKKLNKLSKQLQRGLSIAFNRFDEYQFSKYDRETAVTLKDALFLVHPKAKDDQQQALFDKIVNDALKTAYTWETELSALGQQSFESEKLRSAARKAKWEELIFSKKMGYMATLRNLRNILNADVSHEALDKICAYLADPKAVAESRQLPFRFLSAYRELKDVPQGWVPKVLSALEQAVALSAANIEGYNADTRIVLAADVSGSMQSPVSPKSKVQNFDIGLMLAMLLQNRCANVVTGMFGDKWKIIQVPKDNILASVYEFHRREGEVGYSTNGYLIIQDLLSRKVVVDKVMIFTDMQLWNSNNDSHSISGLWGQYKELAPHAKLYLFDLAGHGTTPLKLEAGDVYLIAGWSDKIFSVLNAIEKGSDALEVIDNIKL
jgi:hypothetical protein